ncbi:MAG: ankyrin repeat domain-containing protein [Clostridia bacterium]|nr:ankyrin repeat domain-containing protein [Clostridia bacterium]
MSKKYNTRKNFTSKMLKTSISNSRPNRRYHNTSSDWINELEQKEQEKLNQEFLTYAFQGNKKMVSYVLTTKDGNGANINAVDKNLNNALILAVYSGDVATVNYLLNFNREDGEITEGYDVIDINHQNKDLISALHLAAHLNNGKLVKILLDAGIPANIIAKYKETPLFFACKQCNDEILDILYFYSKHNKMDINAKNKDGLTALMLCSIEKQRQECLLKLIKFGAKINEVDNLGKNAFMYAAENNFDACLDILLKHTPDFEKMINIQDKNGVSPLMILAKKGNREALRVLISRGANPFFLDKNGKSAIDYANKFNNKTCAEILTKACKIYKYADQMEDLQQKQKFLKEELKKFAYQNRVPNSCLK